MRRRGPGGGISARRAEDAGAARRALERGEVPVLCDPEAAILMELPFDGVVDAILAKRNLGTAITDAPVVLALGPGFTAGVDCHGVVEYAGHNLGRLLARGAPPPTPASPATWGYPAHHPRPGGQGVQPLAAIGQQVEEGQPVARVAGRTACAQLTGVVRGMLPAGLAVTAGMKAGDIDPRCRAGTSPSPTRPVPSPAACWRDFVFRKGRGYGASDSLRRQPRVPGGGLAKRNWDSQIIR